MNNYLALILGVVFAGVGGELFVRGTIGLAAWLRVSAAVIGVSVTAFATSSPELSVAISSALAKAPHIALGDALGSNVVNIALILGIALMFGNIHSKRKESLENFWVALLAPVLLALLAVDGIISRLDGIILLSVFVIWLVSVVVKAHRQRDSHQPEDTPQKVWPIILQVVVGLIMLIAAGRLIVTGASGIAESLGIGKFIIGAVIVAFGTSVPELATVLISRIRKHDDIGLNTVLGSNIFNGLCIIGIASTIYPISLNRAEVYAVIGFGVLTVAITLPSRNDLVQRWRGLILLSIYAVFLLTTISQH